MAEIIERSLKTEKQIALARLQDAVVMAVNEVDPSIVMHGGTAIWRCYNGNRFSDDVDVYLTERQLEKINHGFTWALSKRNVKMEYPKISGGNIIVFNDTARTKFEGMKKQRPIRPVQKDYTRVDGTKFVITTLSIEDFILEKIHTYGKRMYARDLYDIYHLCSIEPLSARVKKALKKFLGGIEKPLNEGTLKDIVYIGAAPTFETMVASIKGKSE